MIGKGHPVFIIAEAGVNHNGSVKIAKKMIDVAKSCGVDAIKFQTFKTEMLSTENAPLAKYQRKAIDGNRQFKMLKKLELTEQQFKTLFLYCKAKKLLFLSTPFDSQSAELLKKTRVSAFKIGSGDITNIPLLKLIASYKKPIILSTGMSTLNEIREALIAINSAGNKKVVLLHCTTQYPTKFKDVNLQAIDSLRKKFVNIVGYSDHTKGYEVAIAAVARGACVIEKHFTLKQNLRGPDHRASLDPKELKKMVEADRKSVV